MNEITENFKQWVCNLAGETIGDDRCIANTCPQGHSRDYDCKTTGDCDSYKTYNELNKAVAISAVWNLNDTTKWQIEMDLHNLYDVFYQGSHRLLTKANKYKGMIEALQYSYEHRKDYEVNN